MKLTGLPFTALSEFKPHPVARESGNDSDGATTFRFADLLKAGPRLQKFEADFLGASATTDDHAARFDAGGVFGLNRRASHAADAPDNQSAAAPRLSSQHDLFSNYSSLSARISSRQSARQKAAPIGGASSSAPSPPLAARGERDLKPPIAANSASIRETSAAALLDRHGKGALTVAKSSLGMVRQLVAVRLRSANATAPQSVKVRLSVDGRRAHVTIILPDRESDLDVARLRKGLEADLRNNGLEIGAVEILRRGAGRRKI